MDTEHIFAQQMYQRMDRRSKEKGGKRAILAALFRRKEESNGTCSQPEKSTIAKMENSKPLDGCSCARRYPITIGIDSKNDQSSCILSVRGQEPKQMRFESETSIMEQSFMIPDAENSVMAFLQRFRDNGARFVSSAYL